MRGLSGVTDGDVVVIVVVAAVDGVIVVDDVEDQPRRADRKFSTRPALEGIFGLLRAEEWVDDWANVAAGSTRAVSLPLDVCELDFLFDRFFEMEPEDLFRFEERAICSSKHRISTLIVRGQTTWFEN